MVLQTSQWWEWNPGKLIPPTQESTLHPMYVFGGLTGCSHLPLCVCVGGGSRWVSSFREWVIQGCGKEFTFSRGARATQLSSFPKPSLSLLSKCVCQQGKDKHLLGEESHRNCPPDSKTICFQGLNMCSGDRENPYQGDNTVAIIDQWELAMEFNPSPAKAASSKGHILKSFC